MIDRKNQEVILVVDDSPETLSMISAALEDIGATVLIAQGGEQALSLIKKVTPDIILLDCVMPGIDGFETCKTLKANTDYQDIPVIFMTGLSETEKIITGFKVGGVDYLTKPIVTEELMARVDLHIATARQKKLTETALDDARRHLIACNKLGEIIWATPQATTLLSTFDADFSVEDHRLTIETLSWLHECLDRPRQPYPTLTMTESMQGKLSLYFLGQTDTNEFLIRISEQNEEKDKLLLMSTFDLTLRETEVLLWVAQGKSNKDIADILEVSPRTINKHLEPVFLKLGVENRTTAATIAMRALWE